MTDLHHLQAQWDEAAAANGRDLDDDRAFFAFAVLVVFADWLITRNWGAYVAAALGTLIFCLMIAPAIAAACQQVPA